MLTFLSNHNQKISEKKRYFLEMVFIWVYLIIPYIDAIYITPVMKDSRTILELQCHNDPKNCWIQVKDKRHE
jgi:hypothetical protein